MQTERREFFIRHDFSFYDCGILGIFPHTMFLLYDLLHRFVWRGETSDGEVEAAQGDGYLIAKVSRRTLAEMLGFVRPQTISDHLRTLKAIGWIRVRYSEDGGSPIYLLGESVYDTAGGRHEVFYARAILGDLVDHLYALAREHRGQNATLHALSYRDRVAATESWLRSKNLFPVPASDPSDPFNGWEEGEGVSLPREGGSRVDDRGGLASARGGVSFIRDQEVGEGLRPSPQTSKEPKYPTRRGGHPPSESPPPPRGRGIGSSQTGSEGRGPGVVFEGNSDLDPKPEEIEQQLPPPIAETEPGEPQAVDPVAALIESRKKALQQAAMQVATTSLRASGVRDTRVENLTRGKRTPAAERANLKVLEGVWLGELRGKYPMTVFAAWGKQEARTASELLQMYGVDLLSSMFRHFVTIWDEFNQRVFKGASKTPTLMLLRRFHETISAEAQKGAQTADIDARIEEWYRDHPDLPLPEDLREEYARVTQSKG